MMLEALSFLGFALLHLGVRIAADFAVIDEPRRPFAVIVEGVAAVLTRRTWAWVAATSPSGPTPASSTNSTSGSWTGWASEGSSTGRGRPWTP